MLSSSIASAQDFEIKWNDAAGREFSIYAISGNFKFGALPGDNLNYNYNGKISLVGLTRINYNYDGKVSSVGLTRISYNYEGKVSSVGGLSVYYDYLGRVSGTSGNVNY